MTIRVAARGDRQYTLSVIQGNCSVVAITLSELAIVDILVTGMQGKCNVLVYILSPSTLAITLE